MGDPVRRVTAPLGLFLFTLAIRLPGLDRPAVFVFDEVFYATDAVDLLDRGVESGIAVHPPTGKWLIAGGIWLAGLDPVGWRLSSALAGALLVVLVYAVARRLVTGLAVPVLVALLVALDGVVFVTSRLALLDVFVAVFMTGALYFVVDAWTRRPDWRTTDLVGCAVCLGAGASTKWTAIMLLPVAIFAFLLVAQAHAAQHPVGGIPSRRYASVVGILLLLPAGLYLASYAGWFLSYEHTRSAFDRCGARPCAVAFPAQAADWVTEQQDIARFHADLEQDNPDAVPLWTWLPQSEPTALFRKECLPSMAEAPEGSSDGVCDDRNRPTTVMVSAAVNPVVWFAGLGAGIVLAGRVARRTWERWRRGEPTGRQAGVPRQGTGTSVLLLAAGLVPLVPWVVTGREVFSFYAVATVPTLAAWTAAAVAPRRPLRRWVLPATVVAAGLAFVVLYPVWTAAPLDPDAWPLRLWFVT